MTEIVPTFTLGALDLTASPYAVEFGADLGSPQNVYEALMTALADGEAVASDRVSNREIVLTVLVEGTDPASLAAAEAALIAETEKARNVLTIVPDEGYAATAFDTFRAQAVLQRNDDEERNYLRRYALTIPALPHGRSTVATVTTATSSGSETVLDSGDSLSGWTRNGAPGSFTISAGTMVATWTSGGFITGAYLRKTPISWNVASTPIVAVRWQNNYSIVAPSLNITDQTGTQTAVYETVRDVSGGWNTSYFSLPTGTTTITDFWLLVGFPNTNNGTQSFTVDKVSAWTALPFIGTSRQRPVALVTGGSVRTQGSIAVEDPSTGLGKVIVYTYPSGTGFIPALSPSLSSSPTTPTTDSTTISGKRVAVNGSGVVYGVPATRVPASRAQLWAFVRSPSAGTHVLNWSVGNASTSALTFDAAWNTTGSTSVSLAANTWTLVPLAEAPSQYRKVGPNGYVRVGISQASGPGTVEIDEAWLFPLDGAALTVADVGTGTPASGGISNRLWIDAPSLDKPQGGLFQGTLASRADEHYVTAISSFMDHNFDPAGMSAFVVTSASSLPKITLTHYRRWHTSAAA